MVFSCYERIMDEYQLRHYFYDISLSIFLKNSLAYEKQFLMIIKNM